MGTRTHKGPEQHTMVQYTVDIEPAEITQPNPNPITLTVMQLTANVMQLTFQHRVYVLMMKNCRTNSHSDEHMIQKTKTILYIICYIHFNLAAHKSIDHNIIGTCMGEDS